MPTELPEPVDAALTLLDRQILDRNDREVAKVDDLELTIDHDGRPYVSAILCGPGAWGPRIGGRIGGWIVAIWSRLHPAAHPQPVAIPMGAVDKIDASVHLNADRHATGAESLDEWVDRYLIGRIPGADHGDA